MRLLADLGCHSEGRIAHDMTHRAFFSRSRPAATAPRPSWVPAHRPQAAAGQPTRVGAAPPGAPPNPPPGLSIMPWVGDEDQTRVRSSHKFWNGRALPSRDRLAQPLAGTRMPPLRMFNRITPSPLLPYPSLQALSELQQRMAATPYAGAADDETLRWFLLDRKLDVAGAEEKLVQMLRWRVEFGADQLQLTDVAKEAATGKAYLHSHRDAAGRPVIIVRAARHISGAAPLIESQRLCVYVLDRALNALTEDGGPPPTLTAGSAPATFLGIFDLRGFTSANADLGFVRFLVDSFFTYYPKRLSQVLFVDAPWVFRPGWEMIKPVSRGDSSFVIFLFIVLPLVVIICFWRSSGD
jgi:hypothetical protein